MSLFLHVGCSEKAVCIGLTDNLERTYSFLNWGAFVVELEEAYSVEGSFQNAYAKFMLFTQDLQEYIIKEHSGEQFAISWFYPRVMRDLQLQNMELDTVEFSLKLPYKIPKTPSSKDCGRISIEHRINNTTFIKQTHPLLQELLKQNSHGIFIPPFYGKRSAISGLKNVLVITHSKKWPIPYLNITRGTPMELPQISTFAIEPINTDCIAPILGAFSRIFLDNIFLDHLPDSVVQLIKDFSINYTEITSNINSANNGLLHHFCANKIPKITIVNVKTPKKDKPPKVEQKCMFVGEEIWADSKVLKLRDAVHFQRKYQYNLVIDENCPERSFCAILYATTAPIIFTKSANIVFKLIRHNRNLQQMFYNLGTVATNSEILANSVMDEVSQLATWDSRCKNRLEYWEKIGPYSTKLYYPLSGTFFQAFKRTQKITLEKFIADLRRENVINTAGYIHSGLSPSIYEIKDGYFGKEYTTIEEILQAPEITSYATNDIAMN